MLTIVTKLMRMDFCYDKKSKDKNNEESIYTKADPKHREKIMR